MNIRKYRWVACLLVCAMMLGMWNGNVARGEERESFTEEMKAYKVTYEWKMNDANRVICVAKAESENQNGVPIIDTASVETSPVENSTNILYTTKEWEKGNDSVFGKAAVEIKELGKYSLEYTWDSNKNNCTAKKNVINAAPVDTAAIETAMTETKKATCTKPGEREYKAIFAGGEFGTLTVCCIPVPAIGHRYRKPEYEWDFNKTECNAKVTCKNKGCEYEINEKGKISSKVSKEATCTGTGEKKYVAKFNSQCFQDQTKTEPIPATGHEYINLKYKWSNDYRTCKVTKCCQRCETTEEETQTAIPKITKRATCTEDGEETYTVTFADKSVQTTSKPIPATGHDYQINYTWNPDNTECLGIRVCQNDTSDVVESRVASTYAITKAATYEEDGEGIYIASFEGDIFATQTKKVIIPKLKKGEQTPPTYTLTLNPNKGTLSQQLTIPFTADGISKLSLPTPTRKGYKFIGWYDGKNRIEKITEAKDVTLKAQWIKGSIDLKYQSVLKWSKYLDPDVKLTKITIEKKYTKHVKINQKKGTMEGKKYFKKAKVTLTINGKKVDVTVKTVIPAPKIKPKKKGLTAYVVGVYLRYKLNYTYLKGATKVVAEYSSKKNRGFKKCGSAQNKLKGASASVRKGTKLYLRVTVYYGKVKSPVSGVVLLKA